MSATRARKAPRSPMRKVACLECGYTVRMARSWMLAGMPTCPCGTLMAPDTLEDRAYAGLITRDDMKGAEWTIICRSLGWDDAIQRKGAAALAYAKHSPGILRAPRGPAAHCAYPGCGLWVAAGAERCQHGHAQTEDAPEMAVSMPF